MPLRGHRLPALGTILGRGPEKQTRVLQEGRISSYQKGSDTFGYIGPGGALRSNVLKKGQTLWVGCV